jgi:VWFA-related protein
MRRAFVILGVMLAAGAVPRPQEESGTVIRQNVQVVHVLAGVKDKNGRAVAGLTAADFVLQEDGRSQTIIHFSRSDSLPLSLGLLVDTSRSQRRLIEQEKTASRLFFEQVLRPETDQACLLRFDFEAALMKNLTQSRAELEAALKRVRLAEERLHLPPDSGGTVLYDAVYLAAGDILATPAGQKAMVVISDGVDFGSMVTLADAVAAAQRAETAVYCIRYADPEAYQRKDQGGHGGSRGTGGVSIGIPFPIPIPGGPTGRPGGGPGGRPGKGSGPSPADGKQTLQQLAADTGGALFDLSDGKDLEAIYRQIGEELRNQYVIGYIPDTESTDGAFRQIRLETKQKGLTVRCRAGYFPGRKD